jgi:hypothetical protein
MAVERERRRREGREEGRRIRAERLDRGRVLPRLREHVCDRVLGLERRPSGEQLEEDDPERVHVALRADLAAGRLLGSHVLRRPDHGSRRGQRRVGKCSGDSEVRDLRATLAVEEHVGGLEIAVDDAVLVRLRQARGDVPGDPGDLLVGERRRQALVEGPAGHVFEHQIEPVLELPVVEHGHDVRVREGGRRARLALEPRRGTGRGQELDRDGPFELEVVGEPDLGHAAAPEKPLEPEPPSDDVGRHAAAHVMYPAPSG